ncbi:MAG: LeuA family protein [Planctomycetota bacterium]
MTEINESELIYDWNLKGDVAERPKQKIEFDDETLRDGLQSPSVTDPTTKEKIEILHLMDRMGIDSADIGLPGAGPRAVEAVTALAKEIVDSRLAIRPNCAARTVKADITPVIEISQKVGVAIEACTFIGSSPIRQYAEEWTIQRMLENTETAVTYAVGHGLPVMYVTEDTVRSHPETLQRLFTAAIDCGAKRLCLCDTVGHATPDGVRALVAWVKAFISEKKADVKLDWHGHQDRGLGVINSIAALRAGVNRVHGCGIGIGERVGNTPMDLLLVNLKLLGWIENDLKVLSQYCNLISLVCKVPLPKNYPVVGADAFRTGTGVHAAAVIKAQKKGDAWLADRIYSGVPAGLFGLAQKIEVGPMSGLSNVVYWLEQRGYEPTDALAEAVFKKAKEMNRLLEDREILAIVEQHRRTGR